VVIKYFESRTYPINMREIKFRDSDALINELVEKK